VAFLSCLQCKMRDKIIQLAWELTTHKDTPEELLEMRSLAKLLKSYCELNSVSHKGGEDPGHAWSRKGMECAVHWCGQQPVCGEAVNLLGRSVDAKSHNMPLPFYMLLCSRKGLHSPMAMPASALMHSKITRGARFPSCGLQTTSWTSW
jgi:hypothetical protein